MPSVQTQVVLFRLFCFHSFSSMDFSNIITETASIELISLKYIGSSWAGVMNGLASWLLWKVMWFMNIT